MNQYQETPVTITSARPSRSSDIRKRQMRYLMSMAVRTACFVLAIVTTGPLRWSLVAGAVFLPYFAVVLANAGDRRSQPSPQAFSPEVLPLLEAPKPASASDDRPR